MPWSGKALQALNRYFPYWIRFIGAATRCTLPGARRPPKDAPTLQPELAAPGLDSPHNCQAINP